MSGRRRWVAGVLAAVATLTVLATVFHRPLLRQAATMLVVEDRLEHADAIVVVAGGTPSREAMAATLFREGWAPRVIISRPVITSNIRDLIALGVRPVDLQGESRLALLQYGVPADRIIAMGTSVRTTEPELRLVHEARTRAATAGSSWSPRRRTPGGSRSSGRARTATVGSRGSSSPPDRRVHRGRLVAPAPSGRSAAPRVPRPAGALPRDLPAHALATMAAESGARVTGTSSSPVRCRSPSGRGHGLGADQRSPVDEEGGRRGHPSRAPSSTSRFTSASCLPLSRHCANSEGLSWRSLAYCLRSSGACRGDFSNSRSWYSRTFLAPPRSAPPREPWAPRDEGWQSGNRGRRASPSRILLHDLLDGRRAALAEGHWNRRTRRL